MLGITGVLECSEVDIGDPLIRFMHDSNTDVSIFLVFSVQSISHHIVTGLGMEGGDAENLVSSTVLVLHSST